MPETDLTPEEEAGVVRAVQPLVSPPGWTDEEDEADIENILLLLGAHLHNPRR